MAPPVATTLATDGRSVDGAFLLLGSPESPEYAALLRDEVDKISGVFTMEPVMQNRKIALFKLTPHR